jgi:hypothetical protein
MLSEPPPGEVTTEVLRAVQHVAGDLDPVLHESGLHLRHRRALEAKMRVAPVLGILRIAAPFVGDAGAAGVADAPVDDHDLAVAAVIDARERVPAPRVVFLHLDARRLHLLHRFFVDLAAAQCVEQHVHLDPGPGALDERLGERRAGVARPVDVALEGDGVARAADRLQHICEDLLAVDERLRAVSGHERRPEHHVNWGSAEEFRPAHAAEPCTAALNPR